MVGEKTLEALNNLADKLEVVSVQLRSPLNTVGSLETMEQILQDCAAAMKPIRKLDRIERGL